MQTLRTFTVLQKEETENHTKSIQLFGNRPPTPLLLLLHLGSKPLSVGLSTLHFQTPCVAILNSSPRFLCAIFLGRHRHLLTPFAHLVHSLGQIAHAVLHTPEH